jgi:Reverse transcriptase (RNA-dependent DNA polymerase)
MFRGRHVRVRLEPVAKASGGTRWIARLGSREAQALDRAVSAVVPPVEASLSRSVLAERVRGRGTVAWTELEPWPPARRRFSHAVATFGADRRRSVLLTDVLDCYASMSAAVVQRSLRAAGCDPLDVRRIVKVLDRFNAAGIPGLPIGPPASAVLANAVLCGVDRAIEATGLQHLRWVDDIVLAAPEKTIPHAMDVIATALEELRLRPNESKTRLIPAGTTLCLRPSRSPGAPLP